jgi:hypothetical protein
MQSLGRLWARSTRLAVVAVSWKRLLCDGHRKRSFVKTGSGQTCGTLMFKRARFFSFLFFSFLSAGALMPHDLGVTQSGTIFVG